MRRVAARNTAGRKPAQNFMAATPSPLAISVMLVDDHPVMRVGLANVLSLNHGFRIVAQAVARGFELGLLKIGAGA